MKSRLRHPIKHLREPFGKAGLTVAILALVMALVGGAYAAGGLTKSQEKQVTKIAKKYAGKPGATGATGPVGAAGKDGTNGINGKDGASLTATESSGTIEGTHCKEVGGSKFVSASGTTYACNGKEGSPWTAGGTLPSGETETGSFAVNGVAEEEGLGAKLLAEPIPFTIPLKTAPATAKIHLIGVNEGAGETHENAAIVAEECTGTAHAPGAASGNLCLFLALQHNLDLNLNGAGEPQLGFGHTVAVRSCELEEGACTTGTVLMFHPTTEAETMFAAGTWAVGGD